MCIPCLEDAAPSLRCSPPALARSLSLVSEVKETMRITLRMHGVSSASKTPSSKLAERIVELMSSGTIAAVTVGGGATGAAAAAAGPGASPPAPSAEDTTRSDAEKAAGLLRKMKGTPTVEAIKKALSACTESVRAMIFVPCVHAALNNYCICRRMPSVAQCACLRRIRPQFFLRSRVCVNIGACWGNRLRPGPRVPQSPRTSREGPQEDAHDRDGAADPGAPARPLGRSSGAP
jgi:hypothetical protein